MKNFVFIVSHLGSGSAALLDVLNGHGRVQAYDSGATYRGYEEVAAITSLPHKLKTNAAIYADHLLFNQCFQAPALFDVCQFVYVLRRGREAAAEVARLGYSPLAAVRHYTFRIRRMCEMARRTPGAVVLTTASMCRPEGMRAVESYLRLRSPLEIPTSPPPPPEFPYDLAAEAEESFERHLYYLSRCEVVMPRA